MNSDLMLLIAICFIWTTIEARCKTSFNNIYDCNLKCMKDILKELPEDKYNFTDLYISTKETSCEAIELKTFGEKFPNLTYLKISASSCPFKDLNFDRTLPILEVFKVINNGKSLSKKGDEISSDMTEKRENLKELDILHLDNLCCEHFWDMFEAPALIDLVVNCSNIQTVVSGKAFRKVSFDQTHKYIYAPNLLIYESSTKQAPKLNKTVSNLKELYTMKLDYQSISETVKLPKDFLYKLPALRHVNINGLTSMQKSIACENLGSNLTMSLDIANTSPVIFHSCPELLNFNSSNTDLTQSITYTDASTNDIEGGLFLQKKMNATKIHFNNVPINLPVQFPKREQFEYISFLKYDNQNQPEINYQDIRVFLKSHIMHSFKIYVNSCNESFVEETIKFYEKIKYISNLQIICKALICQMNNGDEYMCKPHKVFEFTDSNYHNRNIYAQCIDAKSRKKCSKIKNQSSKNPKPSKCKRINSSIDCSVNCMSDFLEEFSELLYDHNFLNITLNGHSCGNTDLKKIGEKFPKLTTLDISAPNCPFNNLKFNNRFLNLQKFTIARNGESNEEDISNVPLEEYNESLEKLTDLTIQDVCCEHFWKVLKVPNVAMFHLNCSNIQTIASGEPFEVISHDPHYRYIHAPSMKTYFSVTEQNLKNNSSENSFTTL